MSGISIDVEYYVIVIKIFCSHRMVKFRGPDFCIMMHLAEMSISRSLICQRISNPIARLNCSVMAYCKFLGRYSRHQIINDLRLNY